MIKGRLKLLSGQGINGERVAEKKSIKYIWKEARNTIRVCHWIREDIQYQETHKTKGIREKKNE